MNMMWLKSCNALRASKFGVGASTKFMKPQMAFSMTSVSFLWASLQEEPYCLGSIFGPLIFGNSQVLVGDLRALGACLSSSSNTKTE